MELNEFVAHVAEQFDETEPCMFSPNTKFRELDEWSSLIALNIIAMIDEEYDIVVKGNDMRAATTIEDLFNMVKACAVKN